MSGGPNIATSHSNRLSSLHSLTRNPSTGSSCKLLYSNASARTAELLGVDILFFLSMCVSSFVKFDFCLSSQWFFFFVNAIQSKKSCYSISKDFFYYWLLFFTIFYIFLSIFELEIWKSLATLSGFVCVCVCWLVDFCGHRWILAKTKQKEQLNFVHSYAIDTIIHR